MPRAALLLCTLLLGCPRVGTDGSPPDVDDAALGSGCEGFCLANVPPLVNEGEMKAVVGRCGGAPVGTCDGCWGVCRTGFVVAATPCRGCPPRGSVTAT